MKSPPVLHPHFCWFLRGTFVYIYIYIYIYVYCIYKTTTKKQQNRVCTHGNHPVVLQFGGQWTLQTCRSLSSQHLAHRLGTQALGLHVMFRYIPISSSIYTVYTPVSSRIRLSVGDILVLVLSHHMPTIRAFA